MTDLSMTQQVELKHLEYQCKQMSREQLETFALHLAHNLMSQQNAYREIIKNQLIGETGL